MPLKPPPPLDMDPEKLKDFLQRAEERLNPQDFAFISTLLGTVLFLQGAVQRKSTSIMRLLRMLFGSGTESSGNLFHRKLESSPGHGHPRKGHGRNDAGSYPGGKTIPVLHEEHKAGDRCPECWRGKLYRLAPGVFMRFFAAAPIQVVIYLLEKLRCNLCGQIYTAEKPPQAGERKYDETVGSMVAISKYGGGVPFNRLGKLQKACGIPLSASTQWEIVEEKATELMPVYAELMREGAQGDVIYQDDTTARVLSLSRNRKTEGKTSGRKGTFTTGLVCKFKGDKTIACFFTGQNHAGENLREFLKERSSELSAPIQMCDALSRNMPEGLKTILCNCLAHGRRNFVNIMDAFPEGCKHVIDILAVVYGHDSMAKEMKLSPEQRLELHREKSAPLMDELKEWMEEQLGRKLVEPNSGMGKAIVYMLDRWEKLTLFLRIPGAPLDNNICERALKTAILHRKNSLYYRTEKGARVGDLFMSLIHTCNLMKVNAFEYLTTLLRNADKLAANPRLWMPWNYRENLACIPP